METQPFRTIVVGYDGLQPAEHALDRAMSLARAFGAKVVVADVAVPVPVQEAPGAFGYGPYHSYTAELGLRTDTELWQRHRDHIAELLDAAGITYEFTGVVGQPASEIVDVAEQAGADLIVVGTREPGLLERLLGGSVSQGVARQARCDVLIVHPPEPEQA
ncbi:MAG TPA: universal stress protein [Gaiellaceae bacterium]|nr:universal stress protein [Gaiellaceae bacterium]